jgi:3-oxoacyl-[acyl-carrier protein] reductase
MPNAPRVVWITGAGGGLGQALVSALADAGWQVAAAFRSRAPAFANARVWPVRLDVTDSSRADAVAGEIASRFGRLDALVNNAGLSVDKPFWQLRDDDWDAVLAVNLRGAFACARAAARLMTRQRDGHIINVSSFAARHGSRGQAAYAAAKAGVIGLTQSLAQELGPRNVRANAVLPGVLATPMTARLSRDVFQRLVDANALRRENDAGEVARFIATLAGMANVSGQVFQLDSRAARWT